MRHRVVYTSLLPTHLLSAGEYPDCRPVHAGLNSGGLKSTPSATSKQVKSSLNLSTLLFLTRSARKTKVLKLGVLKLTDTFSINTGSICNFIFIWTKSKPRNKKCKEICKNSWIKATQSY